jgi:hypothetical protein
MKNRVRALLASGMAVADVGSEIGYYPDNGAPTAAEFESALLYDVDNAFPVAASTVEIPGLLGFPWVGSGVWGSGSPVVEGVQLV